VPASETRSSPQLIPVATSSTKGDLAGDIAHYLSCIYKK
jgi:hypothetical protein